MVYRYIFVAGMRQFEPRNPGPYLYSGSRPDPSFFIMLYPEVIGKEVMQMLNIVTHFESLHWFFLFDIFFLDLIWK
jgi:hypothetical protein